MMNAFAQVSSLARLDLLALITLYYLELHFATLCRLESRVTIPIILE